MSINLSIWSIVFLQTGNERYTPAATSEDGVKKTKKGKKNKKDMEELKKEVELVWILFIYKLVENNNYGILAN